MLKTIDFFQNHFIFIDTVILVHYLNPTGVIIVHHVVTVWSDMIIIAHGSTNVSHIAIINIFYCIYFMGAYLLHGTYFCNTAYFFCL